MSIPHKTGLYFDEIIVGEEYESPGRTITETDVVMYAGFSGDYNQLHTDEEYSKAHNIYGTRFAHGLLGLSIAEGLKGRLGLYEGTSLASLEWTWKFAGPMLIGDTVRVRWTISKKRETSKPDRGIVWEDIKLLNQKDELIAEGVHTVMMQRKPQPA
jgi:acyl dehydratase